MTVSHWQLVALAAATAVNLLVAYRIYCLGSDGLDAGFGSRIDDTAGVTDDPGVDDETRTGGSSPPDRVRCPDCGAENESGYRFCRSCLAELPGAVRLDRRETNPLGGLTR